jgi:hypothetical protein
MEKHFMDNLREKEKNYNHAIETKNAEINKLRTQLEHLTQPDLKGSSPRISVTLPSVSIMTFCYLTW